MALDPVLVDTWALLALINRDDQWHQAAVVVSRQLAAESRPLIVTDWILTEFLGGAASPLLRQSAVNSIRQFQTSSRVEIIAANRAGWQRGFELYESRPDKGWSLVDCISILVCADRGIGEVFSGDHHFEQAGLRLLR